MKNRLLIMVVTAVSFAAAYWVVSFLKEAKFQRELAAREAAWQVERSGMEAAGTAGQKSERIRTIVKSSGPQRESPQVILDKLINLKPGEGDETRNRVIRRILTEFQRLVDHGPDSLPVIRTFLAENRDVDYVADDISESGERSGRGDRFTSRNPVRTDFLAPPSLRLGLLDTLKQIGGDDAEKILAQTLATTGRGVEVAYLARILEEQSPGKHRDTALAAAKDLLTNPPKIEMPNRLDENARAYLYEVILMYQDTSFAPTAQKRLVSSDGRIDRQALYFLDALLKDQAMPGIYTAYKDTRLTNQWERTVLVDMAANYAGPSEPANTIFAEAVANDAVQASLRAFTVKHLAGSAHGTAPKDPQVIRARLQLLENIKPTIKDAQILRSLDETSASLQKLLNTALAPPAAE